MSVVADSFLDPRCKKEEVNYQIYFSTFLKSLKYPQNFSCSCLRPSLYLWAVFGLKCLFHRAETFVVDSLSLL